MDRVLKEIGDYAFLACGVGAVFFLIIYSIMAKWWRKPGGRFIFTFMAVVAAILVLAGVRLYFGPYPGIVFIRPVAYISLAGILWGLGGVMAYHQIRGMRQRRK